MASVQALRLPTRSEIEPLFEAVSHKRFAHRVYFAFGYSADNVPLSEIEAMRGYGEKFGVGILGLKLSPEKFDILLKGDEKEIQELELVLNDDVVPELQWPAVREDPLFDEHQSFLKRIGFMNDEKMYAFGKFGPDTDSNSSD